MQSVQGTPSSECRSQLANERLPARAAACYSDHALDADNACETTAKKYFRQHLFTKLYLRHQIVAESNKQEKSKFRIYIT